MTHPKRYLTKKFNLEKLSHEELLEFIDSVETDDESSSDDSIVDSNYVVDNIEPDTSTKLAIDECLEGMNEDENTDVFVQSLPLSLNINGIEQPLVAIEEAAAGKTVKNSTDRFKLAKRARSPLLTVESSGLSFQSNTGGFTEKTLAAVSKDLQSNLIWRKRSMCLHINDVAFRGNSSLPLVFKELKTPMQLFNYFFNDEIIGLIVQATNRCAFDENIDSTFNTTIVEIRHYIGVMIYMSLYRYPNLESYWGKNAFLAIQRCMTWKRFEVIKKYLSFQDESQRQKKGEPGYDPLFGIRALANKLNDRFDSVPKTARLCVDEQFCSTKTKHHLREYMNKWGVKLFVLCDSNGFAYRFEVYNGASDNVILPNAPDLGATSNVVIRLSQTIPNFVHHILYFDNFYTSLPLLVYLRARGIYSLGTVRANRIPACKLPTDIQMSKRDRGFSIEYMTSIQGIDVNTVLWKDNKCVRLASTYVGIKPFLTSNSVQHTAKAPRYDRKQKKFVEIDCPPIIREYNAHMGGVELMDGLMGRYHIRAKSRDIMIRLFYHFLDMAATNAYILYKRIHSEHSSEKDLLQLAQFREEIAAGLVAGKDKKDVSRPSSGQSVDRRNSPQPGVLAVGKRALHQVADVHFDGEDHFPVWMDRKGKKRCKHCKKSDTQIVCAKCDLHLCGTSEKNCFWDYHHEK